MVDLVLKVKSVLIRIYDAYLEFENGYNCSQQQQPTHLPCEDITAASNRLEQKKAMRLALHLRS